MTETLLLVARILLIATAALTIVRMLLGPTAHDRVLGLELLTLTFAGFLLLDAGQPIFRLYLDAALVVALFSFIGTVLMARLLETRSKDG